MELQLFQSILGQLSPTNLSRERLVLLLGALQDNQLLSFIFSDAENDLSETHQKSAELRAKWLRRTMELLGNKQEAAVRVCGLSLLQSTIPVVTYELALSNYEAWFAQLLGIISQKGAAADAVSGAALLVTSDLIVVCQKWPDIKREVMKDNIFGSFVTSLIKLLEENFKSNSSVAVPDILKCLISTLRQIQHNKLRSQQARLLRALVTALDRDPSCRHMALEAISLLPENNATWNQIVEPTIEAMHFILHHLYEGFDVDASFKNCGAIDESEPSVISETLQLFISSVRTKRADLVLCVTRLRWMASIIERMLRSGPAAIIAIPVESLLDLIEHFLLLDGSVVKSKELVRGLEVAEVVSAIPVLHEIAFQLLETCVTSLRGSSLAYVEGISTLLVDEFNRVRNKGSAGLHGVPLRVSLYAVSRRCLHQFRASADALVGAVASALLRDLKLQAMKSSTPVELDMAAAATSGKKRQRNNNNQPSSSSASVEPQRKSDVSFLEVNNVVLVAALQTLESLLQSVGNALFPDIRTKLDKALLMLFIELQRTSASALFRPIVFSAPFDDPKVRAAMYRALVASSVTSSRTQSSLLTFSITFLTHGIQDPDFSISEYCTQGLASCVPIINPRVPLIPTPIADDQRYNPLVPMQGIQATSAATSTQDTDEVDIPAKRPAFANVGASSFAPPSAPSPAPVTAPLPAPKQAATQQIQQIQKKAAPAKPASKPVSAPAPAPVPASRFSPAVVDNVDVDNVDIVMDGPDSDQDE